MNVVAYSYKGGSGRSTAAVNLAATLFRMGHKVCCVDMDFGAPGLRMILETTIPPDPGRLEGQQQGPLRDPIKARLAQIGDLGIQHFLNAKYPDWQNVDDDNYVGLAALDYKTTMFEKSPFVTDDEDYGRWHFDKKEHLFSGELLFLPASANPRPVDTLSGKGMNLRAFHDRCRHLRKKAAEFLSCKQGASKVAENDIIFILDSASGLTPFSLPVLLAADVVLVFFRWSHQHVEGTLNNLGALHRNLEERINIGQSRIYRVGSCYSSANSDELLQAQARKGDVVVKLILEREERIIRDLEDGTRYENKVVPFITNIPEHPALKFYERIVTVSWDPDGHYQQVRDAFDKIAKIVERDYVRWLSKRSR